MPNTGGRIQAVSNQFMADLDARETQAVLELTTEYQHRVDRLSGDILALDEAIAQRTLAGQSVPVSWVHKQDRYRSLIAQARDEFNKYGASVGNYISDADRLAINKAGQLAEAQLRAAYGGAGNLADRGGFNKLPAPAIERLHGNLTHGSPLRKLTNTYGDWAAQTIEEEMRHSLASGQDPRRTMKNITKKLDYAPTRAATMLRTEQYRAFRQAQLDNFRNNARHVKAWVWNAHTGDRTCPVCWAMHGQEFPLEEVMGTHPNCRCNMIPKTPTWEELGFTGIPETGPDWTPGRELFSKLDDAAQRRILGPRRFDLYKAGRVDLQDMVRDTYSRDWGEGRQLRDIPGSLLHAHGRRLDEAAEAARIAALPKRGRPSNAALAAREQALGLPPLPKDAPQWAKDVRKLQLGYKGDGTSLVQDAANVQKAGKILAEAALDLRQTDKYRDRFQGVQGAMIAAEDEVNRYRQATRTLNNIQHNEGIPPSARRTDPRTLELDRLLRDSERRYRDAEHAYRTVQNTVNREVLEQVRPFGPTKDMIFDTANSEAELIDMARKMAEYLPQSWVDRAIDAHAPGIYTKWVDRGHHFYKGYDQPIEVFVSGSPGPAAESTMLHELMHYVERAGAEIKAQERHFYDRRTRGETSVKLGPGYGDHEITKPDDFTTPYMGRDYGRDSFEVMTMGVEGTLGPEYTSQATNIRFDDDHFEWVLGMLGIVP